MRRFGRLAVLACGTMLAIMPVGGVRADCPADWTDGFGFRGNTNARIHTSLVADLNGNGPSLYLAGNFSSIGGIRAPSVVRYDGSQFHPLGSGLFLSQTAPGIVTSLAVFQGELYAAGNFNRVGQAAGATPPVAAQRYFIAKFDGNDWVRVGNGFTLTSLTAGRAYEMAVFDDGTGDGEKLWIVGNTNFAVTSGGGTVATQGLTTWNGVTLAAPGSPMISPRTIRVIDDNGTPRMFVGGRDGLFERAGGTWIQLSGGESVGGVSNFTWFDPDGDGPLPAQIYAVTGQSYASFGDTVVGSAGQLARWDGSAWHSVDLGLSAGEGVARVHAADLPAGPRLCISAFHPSGNPTTFGSFFLSDGTTAESLGAEGLLPSIGNDTAVDYFGDPEVIGDGLLVTGRFSNAGTSGAVNIALFDGTAMAPLFGNNGIARAGAQPREGVRVIDNGSGPAIYVTSGLSFGEAGEAWVGRWDGSNWEVVGTDWPRSSGSISYNTGSLHVFDTPSGQTMYTFGTRLESTEFGTDVTPLITRFVNDEWVEVSAPEGTPRDIDSGYWVGVNEDGDPETPPVLYHLSNALSDPTTATVQRFDGTGFTEIPLPPSLTPGTRRHVLASYDATGTGVENLYLGATGGVFRYNNDGTWTTIAQTEGSTAVQALFPYSDSSGNWLIASGNFRTIDGNTMVRAAYFNGTSWAELGGGIIMSNLAGNTTGTVCGSAPLIRVVDFGDGIPGLGSGRKLLAGPVFNANECSTAGHMVELNGPVGGMSSWVPFIRTWTTSTQPCGFQTAGIPSICVATPVLETAVMDDGAGLALYVFGGFMNVAGFTSEGMARFGCPIPDAPTCLADFNNDGSVTVDDIFAFLSAWFANDPAADINNSSTITVDDIFAFLSLWFAGC